MTMFTRRHLLLGAASTALAPAASKLDRSRFSVLTDEVGPGLEAAIAFARQYRLSWVELRLEPGHGYYEAMPPEKLKQTRGRLDDSGLKISFLNSTLLKFTYPGTEAIDKEEFYEKQYRANGWTPESMFRERNDKLRRALDAAHLLGVNQIRAFTFWRTREPRALFPKMADIFHEMAEEAAKARIRILIESETATNTATSAEVADFVQLLPSKAIGINWDPQNSLKFEPDVFPAGYEKLPKKRIGNVQMKAAGLIGETGRLDWGAIFRRMNRDGYTGRFGLETHTLKEDGTNVAASHRCLKEMLRLIGES
jgi:sugar phosphate isomerase/epimerase